MASNYPGSLDSFDTIAADKKTSDAVGGRTHRAMHNDLGDAIEAVQAELGVNPSGSAATVVARLDAAEGSIGNLLTANQASCTDASGDTTGFAAYDASLSRSTAWAAQGSGSLLVTATGSGVAVDVSPGGTGGIPVTAGETVTATATVKGGTSTDALALRIIFWDSGGGVVSSSESYTTLSGTPSTASVTGVAPAGAAYMSLAAIGDSMTAGDTFYIDKAGLWKGAGGQFALPGTPILALTDGLAGIGNLLTANQASGTDALGTTSGFTGWQATLARSTAWAAQGTGSLLVTATDTGPAVDVSPGGTNGIPVTPGETVTATVTTKAGTATGRTGELRIIWWDAGGSPLSSTSTTWTLGSQVTATGTGVAPASTAYASHAVIVADAVVTETFYIDRAGLWKGAGGVFALPGVPIVHTGIRPNPSNTAQVQVWNDATATWITV